MIEASKARLDALKKAGKAFVDSTGKLLNDAALNALEVGREAYESAKSAFKSAG